MTQLIAADEKSLQRQSTPAPNATAAGGSVPARFQGPASAPTTQMRAVLPVASIAQISAARSAIENLQPEATVSVALGPASVPVGHADKDAALNAIRHTLMEALVRNLADARARSEPEPALVKIARDYLNALRGAAAPEHFQHPDPAVRDAVTGALGLEQVDRALAEEAAQNRAGPDPTNPAHSLPNAEARARAGGVLPGNADWCGAFAMSMQRQSGATPQIAGFMQGTEGVISLLSYRTRHWIQTGGAWSEVEAFHTTERNSRRFWREIDPTSERHNPADFDIRPGDIVLMDLVRGTRPDHIAMVRSYDRTTGTLVTVGGNEGTLHPVHVSGPRNLTDNPRAVEHPRARRLTELQQAASAASAGRGPALTDAQRAELTELGPIITAWDAQHKPSRVFGWGRLSLVDYETHPYRLTAPPASAPRR